jgi:hypothetical protein
MRISRQPSYLISRSQSEPAGSDLVASEDAYWIVGVLESREANFQCGHLAEIIEMPISAKVATLKQSQFNQRS